MSQEWTKDIFFTETTVNAFDSYSTFIGDNVNSQFTIIHNLCSQDVVVTVRDVNSNLISYPAVEITSLSSVTVGFNFVPGPSAYDVTVFASASAKKITGFEDRIVVDVTQPVQDITVDVTTPQTNLVVTSEQDVTTIVTNTQVTTTDVNVGVVDAGAEEVDISLLSNGGIWGSIVGVLSAQTDLWTYLLATQFTDKVLVSTNFDAQKGYSYLVNTTTGSVTATLPLSPQIGHTIQFKDPYLTWNTNNLVLNNNTNMIEGSYQFIACDINGLGFTLTFVGSNVGWRIE